MLQRFTGLLGLLAILGIAYALSSNRKAIQWRVVVWGVSLQFAFALLVLQTTVGRTTFGWLGEQIRKLLSFGQYGSSFVFGELGTPGEHGSQLRLSGASHHHLCRRTVRHPVPPGRDAGDRASVRQSDGPGDGYQRR